LYRAAGPYMLALFGPASRANQCPSSGVKQPCRRNLETADFDPKRSFDITPKGSFARGRTGIHQYSNWAETIGPPRATDTQEVKP
jgi:hypothetical protein